MNNIKCCNTSLPNNAINVVDLKPGMRIRFAFEGTGTHIVESVSAFGFKRTIVTDKGRREANTAGTVRLVDVDGYNYHSGHGCVKDV